MKSTCKARIVALVAKITSNRTRRSPACGSWWNLRAIAFCTDVFKCLSLYCLSVWYVYIYKYIRICKYIRLIYVYRCSGASPKSCFGCHTEKIGNGWNHAYNNAVLYNTQSFHHTYIHVHNNMLCLYQCRHMLSCEMWNRRPAASCSRFTALACATCWAVQLPLGLPEMCGTLNHFMSSWIHDVTQRLQ